MALVDHSAVLDRVEELVVRDPVSGGASLSDRMRHYAVQGVSLAVMAEGAIVAERAYGVKDVRRSDPVTPATLFQACSISKPVTALAMLRLVDQGALALDDDVNDYLSAWKVPPNGPWQPRVSLRQLASHSAGMTASGFPGYRRGEPLPTLVQILTGTAPANTEAVRVDTVPGTQFRYSGGGTQVIQLVLAEATGTPHEDLLDELVLAPLGMRDSTFVQPLPDHLHPAAATAHHTDGTPVEGGWHVYPEQAAAGLWSTPGDLCRYALGVYEAYSGSQRLLRHATAHEMLTPQISSTDLIGGLHALGIGPFVGEARTDAYFGHSGGNEGFRCHLLAHRDAGLGAAVMTNGDAGHDLVSEVFAALAREYDWPGYESGQPPQAREQESALERFTGSFELRPGVGVHIRRHGDVLMVQIGDQSPITFVPTSATTLASGSVDTLLRFPGPGKPADAIMFVQNGEELALRPVGPT